MRLDLHLEQAGDEAVWWADTAEAPGFTAAGSTLAEVRQLCREALGEFEENLVGRPLVIVGPF